MRDYRGNCVSDVKYQEGRRSALSGGQHIHNIHPEDWSLRHQVTNVFQNQTK